MTLDELTHRSRTRPQELERWRTLGAFGDRWKEPRERGMWRHITKLVAHRAILMRTLLDAGLTEGAALRIVQQHEIKDKNEPLHVRTKGVNITIWRSSLKLP
jgi:Fe2+ transport system protein FeoA